MADMNDRLREAREIAGFDSAMSVAKKFGWSPSTYAAHENGQNGFKPEVAAKYARAFKTTAAWLLTGEGEGPKKRPLVSSFDPDEPDRRLGEFDLPAPDRAGKLISRDDLPPDAIVELVAQGGMGSGTIIESQEHGSLRAQDEIRDEYWSFPPSFVRTAMGTTAANLIAIECQGDSMEPTLKPGEKVWVNVSHKRPSPDGIYVIRDPLGAPAVKRLELTGDDRVRIISDNPKHGAREIHLRDLIVIGKVVASLRLL